VLPLPHWPCVYFERMRVLPRWKPALLQQTASICIVRRSFKPPKRKINRS
jgi:hypothetical protein